MMLCGNVHVCSSGSHNIIGGENHFSGKIPGLILSLMFLLASLSLMFDNSADQSINIQQLIDISEDELTTKQISSLAGGRFSNTNWIHQIGSVGDDEGVITKISQNGDLYISGNICHGVSPCSAAFGSNTIYAKNDIFVAKLDTNGNWDWVVQTSGTDTNAYATLTGIDIDTYGAVFVTGYYTRSKDWGSISKTTASSTWQQLHGGGSSTCNEGDSDGFTARVNSNGSWSWVHTISNCLNSFARGVSIDSNQNIYVIGDSRISNQHGQQNWDPHKYAQFSGSGSSSTQIEAVCYNYPYPSHPWMVKYNAAGVIQWVDRLTNQCIIDAYMNDVITDNNDSVIVTGSFSQRYDGGSLQTLAFGGLSTTSNGNLDVFLAKVNSSHGWEWLTHGGGSSNDQPRSLVVDSSDNIYVSGYNDGCTQHTFCESTFGSHNLSFGGGFVVKALGNGSWQWGTRISPIYSGQTMTTIQDIVVHQNNDLTIVGDSHIRYLNSTGVELWNEANNAEILSLALDSAGSHYLTGYFSGNQNFENNSLISSGSDDAFIWKWDRDRDGDSVADKNDNCGDTQNTNQSDHDKDAFGDACDPDDDNDGMMDDDDDCPRGDVGWGPPVASNDFDEDGCYDQGEDVDDDSDGIDDLSDSCDPDVLADDPRNPMLQPGFSQWKANWNSTPENDHDRDGCHDASLEENDGDNDDVFDMLDSCKYGNIGWGANNDPTNGIITDYDSDGCQDLTMEDQDRDNDGIIDWPSDGSFDSCPMGQVGVTSTPQVDHDGDGCLDGDAEGQGEDTDNDDDGISNINDQCMDGLTSWVSNRTNDHDGDGCKNHDEDGDDDDDGISNEEDACPQSIVLFNSKFTNDWDDDGCHDEEEDDDDDNDHIMDADDFCPTGRKEWISGRVKDRDGDGCRDEDEDVDDDDDGICDEQEVDPNQTCIISPVNSDQCPFSQLDWHSTPTNDRNQNGCNDDDEDLEEETANPLNDTNQTTNSETTANQSEEGSNNSEHMDDSQSKEEKNVTQIGSNSTGLNESTSTGINDADRGAAAVVDEDDKTPLFTYGIIVLISGSAGLGLGLTLRSGRRESNGRGDGEATPFTSANPRDLETTPSEQSEIIVTSEWNDDKGWSWRHLSDGREQWWDGTSWKD